MHLNVIYDMKNLLNLLSKNATYSKHKIYTNERKIRHQLNICIEFLFIEVVPKQLIFCI